MALVGAPLGSTACLVLYLLLLQEPIFSDTTLSTKRKVWSKVSEEKSKV